jgi:hypothetical protein
MSGEALFPGGVGREPIADERLQDLRREADRVLAYTRHPDGSKVYQGRAQSIARTTIELLDEIARLKAINEPEPLTRSLLDAVNLGIPITFRAAQGEER